MRLAIVSPFVPEISGVGQYGVRVAGGLARSGHFSDITVLANAHPGGAPLERRQGLTIERCWRRDHWLTMPRLLAALRRHRPDIVWFNIGLSIYGKSAFANFLGHLVPALARASGLRTVVTLHELFEQADLQIIGAGNHGAIRLGGALATRLILRAHQTCFTLNSYRELAVNKYGARNARHIPHGAFDTPHYTPVPRNGYILFFGAHAPYKGLPGLLEVFQELRERNPALRLVVAGGEHPRFPGYLGDMQATYRQVPGVDWRAQVPEEEVPSLFQWARAVALPYAAATGASSVIHRAAAHGRPVVAYALGDLQAVAADEGLQIAFAQPGDRTAFREGLEQLLSDLGECERLGQHNARAMQAYTLEVTCQRYIEAFEEAAGLTVPVRARSQALF